MKRSALALMTVLSAGIFCASIPSANAQASKMAPPKSTPTAPATKTYYVSAKSKTYYSEAAAKKMGYKDAAGTKLTKSTSIPKGYTDGSKAKPAGKPSSSKMDSKTKM